MQNNAKYFTFLFSHKNNSTIRIRRIQISKSYLQNGILSLALILGISTLTLGIYGVFSSDSLEIADNTTSEIFAGKTGTLTAARSKFDYSRPSESSRFSVNTGGPLLSENTDEDAEIEGQLQMIITTSDAANIPSMWAVMGKINNEFGFRRNPFGGRTYEFHAGMDIDGERGDPIIAPANGTVVKAGWQGGYGNLVEIDHKNGLVTRYGHLSRIEVAVGDEMTRGQLMGYVGSTGRSTGPHLHYELRLGDRPINPRRFLPPEPVDIAKAVQ